MGASFGPGSSSLRSPEPLRVSTYGNDPLRVPASHFRRWSPEDVEAVRQLEQHGVNRKVIARQFDRTPDSIRRLCVRHAIRRIEWPIR